MVGLDGKHLNGALFDHHFLIVGARRKFFEKELLEDLAFCPILIIEIEVS